MPAGEGDSAMIETIYVLAVIAVLSGIAGARTSPGRSPGRSLRASIFGALSGRWG